MIGRTDLRLLVRYMAWANGVMIDNAAQLGEAELTAPKDCLFNSISGTFDHVLLIAEVFLAHLEGRPHGHSTRHRAEARPFETVARELREMDERLVDYAESLGGEALGEPIDFEFIGGGAGCLTREEMLLHLVNHATYHRGFISTLIYPYRVPTRANDLTVYLRDVAVDRTN